MVSLPEGFTATKYPGYFWHVPTQSLYSLKVDGILKPLKISGPNHFNKWHEPGYRVSVEGQRRVLWLSYLQKLKYTGYSEIPVRGRK